MFLAKSKPKLKQILIVEDNEDMQHMYRMFFSGHEDEYSISIEGDPEQALKMISENEYDLVVLDIIMEPLPGDIIFTCMRAYKKTLFMPVLVVSVLDHEMFEHLKKMKNINFLKKPITEEQLLSKIKEILGN